MKISNLTEPGQPSINKQVCWSYYCCYCWRGSWRWM